MVKLVDVNISAIKINVSLMAKIMPVINTRVLLEVLIDVMKYIMMVRIFIMIRILLVIIYLFLLWLLL